MEVSFIHTIYFYQLQHIEHLYCKVQDKAVRNETMYAQNTV